MDEYIQQVASLVDNREKYQRKIGQIAYTVTELYGAHSLGDLSKEVEDATGRKISVSTLRNYRWVYERTMDLQLPEDLSYQALQRIAGSTDPKAWAKRVDKEGLSSAEVSRLLRKETPKKVVICPNCGQDVLV